MASFLNQFINDAILHDATDYLENFLFEPKSQVGSGYAYEDDYSSNLLITRADSMFALASRKDHFIDWVRKNWEQLAPHYPDLDVNESAFLPRSLFGSYLEKLYDDAVDMAAMHGISFRLVRDYVEDIVPLNGGRFCIDTSTYGAFESDRVVLCLGNFASTAFDHLRGSTGFINNPYPGKMLTRTIPPESSVCVLGTSLSAIDTAISLTENGHKGKILCVSRNGRLPSVRGQLNLPVTLQECTPDKIDAFVLRNGSLTLDHIAQMLAKEYHQQTGDPLDLNAVLNQETGTYDYLNTEIELSSKEQRFWQSVIYATNSVIDHIWNRLALQEKRTFYSSLKSLWTSYRVSFPLKNAVKMRELMRKDRVSVYGGLVSVSKAEDSLPFAVKINDTRTGLRSTFKCDVVVTPDVKIVVASIEPRTRGR